MPGTDAIEQLMDRQAIQDVLVRYCRGIDRCDAELLRSAYWEDGTDDHGSFSGNAWEFCDHVIPALQRMQRTMHLISNVHVELQGSTAKAETYCVAHHLLDDENEMVVGGRYLDLLEKRNEEWRIKTRVYVMDWNQNQPATVSWDNPFYSSLKTRGSRYPDDPWYTFAD
jgi:hypothetical protein